MKNHIAIVVALVAKARVLVADIVDAIVGGVAAVDVAIVTVIVVNICVDIT